MRSLVFHLIHIPLKVSISEELSLKQWFNAIFYLLNKYINCKMLLKETQQDFEKPKTSKSQLHGNFQKRLLKETNRSPKNVIDTRLKIDIVKV